MYSTCVLTCYIARCELAIVDTTVLIISVCSRDFHENVQAIV